MTKSIRYILHMIGRDAGLVLWFSAASIVFAQADITNHGGHVDVEDAVITPSPVDGVSVLRLRLENSSGQDVFLVGVSSPVAVSGALVMRMPDHGPMEIERMLIADHEILDLKSSHAWLELRGVRIPIEDGDEIPFSLEFSNGEIPALAHAHPAASDH